VCETHPKIGSLRENSFREIWFSQQARSLRASIAAGKCHCTNEVFLWPSIAFQPLARAQVSSTRTPALERGTVARHAEPAAQRMLAVSRL
jgi:hypothetical protein